MKKNQLNQLKFPKDDSGQDMQLVEFYSNTVQVRATNFEAQNSPDGAAYDLYPGKCEHLGTEHGPILQISSIE